MAEATLFAASASAFSERLADALGVQLSRIEEEEFGDGERRMRPLADVGGRDVLVVQSLHAEPAQGIDAKLLRQLLLIATLQDEAPRRLTAVAPYLCYARQDRQYQVHDPVMTRHLARLFEAVGTTRILTMEVHNPAAFENAYRCQTQHIEAAPLFARHLAGVLGGGALAVVAPDAGGIKRAEQLRRSLGELTGREPPLAFLEKHRGDGVQAGALAGEVAGRTAIVFDDMISSGATLLRAARACREHGATAVVGAAAHGVFAPGAAAAVADPLLDRVVITDSIAPIRLERSLVEAKVTVLSAVPLFAAAIRAGADDFP